MPFHIEEMGYYGLVVSVNNAAGMHDGKVDWLSVLRTGVLSRTPGPGCFAKTILRFAMHTDGGAAAGIMAECDLFTPLSNKMHAVHAYALQCRQQLVLFRSLKASSSFLHQLPGHLLQILLID